jgi:hypothetical protein
MIITNSDFRSLLFVPDKTKILNLFSEREVFEMIEVNSLWIGPSLKNFSMQIKVWMHLIKDNFSSRKQYILLMHSMKNRAMQSFLHMVTPHVLYEGPPLMMSGNKTHDEIQMSYTTRWSLVLNISKYWIELKNRERRAKLSVKQRELART